MARPYVVYPPGWPHKARARAYADLAAARRAARQIANETGQPVAIYIVSRFGGGGSREIGVERPARGRNVELREDVDLARRIGLDE